MQHSSSLTAIAPALVEALSKIGGVHKGKANPAFKGTKYADLESVINASKATLAEHDISLIQFPGDLINGVQHMETVFLHKSGEFMSAEMGIALGKVDPQGVGSALTYMRRYAQMAALNMPAVDDDGEAAMGRQNGEPRNIAPPNAMTPAPVGNGRLTAAEAKRQGLFQPMIDRIDGCDSITALDALYADFDDLTAQHPLSWLEPYRDRMEARRDAIIQRDVGRPDMDAEFRDVVGPGPSSMARRDTAGVN